MAAAHEGRVKVPEDMAVLPAGEFRLGSLDDRIVLLHTGDAPIEKTVSLPDGTRRTVALAANSIADVPVQ